MNIVHIGFPKTATTFLQWEIFPNLKGINYVDYRTCEKIFPDLIYLDELDYDKTDVKKRLDKMMAPGDNLLSFESLVGAPFIYKGQGRSLIPARLNELGFGKVIITIRNQVEMYDSLYRQYVIQGGVMSFRNFLNADKKWNYYVRAFNPGYLYYDLLIEKYQAQFGKENVLILEQEGLKRDKNQFLDQIQKFTNSQLLENRPTGRKVNKSMSNLSIRVLRIVNHFIFTSQKPNNLIWNAISTRNVSRIFIAILEPFFFNFISSRKSFLSPEDKQYIEKKYAESNSRLKTLQ